MGYIEFRGSLRSREEIEQIWADALDASLRQLSPAVAQRVQQTLADCEQALAEDDMEREVANYEATLPRLGDLG